MPDLEFGLEVVIDEAYLLNFEPNLDKLLTEAEDTDLDAFLEISLEEVINTLRGLGKDDAQIPTDESGKVGLVHAYKTVEMLNLRAMKEQGDRFHTRATEFRDRYLTAIQQISFDYDKDKSGTIETSEEDQTGRITFSR